MRRVFLIGKYYNRGYGHNTTIFASKYAIFLSILCLYSLNGSLVFGRSGPFDKPIGISYIKTL